MIKKENRRKRGKKGKGKGKMKVKRGAAAAVLPIPNAAVSQIWEQRWNHASPSSSSFYIDLLLPPLPLLETVCLHCGNIGFEETLVFCNGCQACALHRYCLDGPVIKHDDVIWFCEDCQPKQVVPVSPEHSTPLSSETSDSINLSNNATIQTRELKNCTERVMISNKQQQISIKEEQTKRKVKSCSVTKNDPLSGSLSPPQLEHTQCSNSCEEESMLKNECEPVPRDATNSNGGSKSVQTSEAANSDDLNCVELDVHVAAHPIGDPIWRGTLNLFNETIGSVGLMAHVSDLACPKVHEEASLFPEVLHGNLVPKSMVWPKRFMNEEPTDQSIALYLFPDSERAEIVFHKLVEVLIRNIQAIKVEVENAELLIFPSTVLPMPTWRFNAKYYLWGLFRGKQTSQNTNGAVSREDAAVDKP